MTHTRRSPYEPDKSDGSQRGYMRIDGLAANDAAARAGTSTGAARR